MTVSSFSAVLVHDFNPALEEGTFQLTDLFSNVEPLRNEAFKVSYSKGPVAGSFPIHIYDVETGNRLIVYVKTTNAILSDGHSSRVSDNTLAFNDKITHIRNDAPKGVFETADYRKTFFENIIDRQIAFSTAAAGKYPFVFRIGDGVGAFLAKKHFMFRDKEDHWQVGCYEIGRDRWYQYPADLTDKGSARAVAQITHSGIWARGLGITSWFMQSQMAPDGKITDKRHNRRILTYLTDTEYLYTPLHNKLAKSTKKTDPRFGYLCTLQEDGSWEEKKVAVLKPTKDLSSYTDGAFAKKLDQRERFLGLQGEDFLEDRFIMHYKMRSQHGKTKEFVIAPLYESDAKTINWEDIRNPALDLIGMCTDAAKGVQSVHNAGYVHRDIKPLNFFVTRREGRKGLVLADFESIVGQTELGYVKFGTKIYYAPETQLQPQQTTAMDRFALGLTFFEILKQAPRGLATADRVISAITALTGFTAAEINRAENLASLRAHLPSSGVMEDRFHPDLRACLDEVIGILSPFVIA